MGFSLQKEDFHSSTMHTNPQAILPLFWGTSAKSVSIITTSSLPPRFYSCLVRAVGSPRSVEGLLPSWALKRVAQITWDLETRESILNLSPYLFVAGIWSCPLGARVPGRQKAQTISADPSSSPVCTGVPDGSWGGEGRGRSPRTTNSSPTWWRTTTGPPPR